MDTYLIEGRRRQVVDAQNDVILRWPSCAQSASLGHFAVRSV